VQIIRGFDIRIHIETYNTQKHPHSYPYIHIYLDIKVVILSILYL